jgi:hypothetical protein
MRLESWQRLADALEFYKSKGFVYKEVAWDVSPEISAITCPNPGNEIQHGDNVLVGSAEQSFLAIYDRLDRDTIYFAITPCFRYEEDTNDLTRPYFMKLELFSKNIENLHRIIYNAYEYLSKQINVRMIPTKEGYDIQSNTRGIELGSYGTRRHGSMVWVYGTGLAEPRLSCSKPHEDALII